MRYILLSYLCVLLLTLVIFIVLSFNTGFGYVFVQWHGWQIQTNLFVILLLFFTSVFAIFLLWLVLKRLSRRYLQKYQVPNTFAKLHPYEKLGILWILKAERIEHQKIVNMYQPSFLLYPLIRARIALAQQDAVLAKTWLKDQSTPLFELSELLKIDIALLEKDYTDALNRLEFLSVQPLSSWLMPVEQAYQHELKEKWLLFAQQCPWGMFKKSCSVDFDTAQTSLWLQALLSQSQGATIEEQQALFDWYKMQQHELPKYYVEDQIYLLKLMSQYELLNQEAFLLAEDILQYRFVPEVLYIWLDKGLNHIQDITHLQSKIEQWSQQYPAQPSLTFAQWHIYQKMEKYESAEQLLSLYPEDPYMAYLRLNNVIQSSEQLQDNLKLLMRYSEQNFKFDL